MIFFQVREKSGDSGLSQGNSQNVEKRKVREFQNFLENNFLFNGSSFLRISLPIKDCSLNDYFSENTYFIC